MRISDWSSDVCSSDLYLSDTGANASWRSGETPAPHAPDGYERGHGHPPAYPMYRWPPSRAPTPALPPPRGADAVRRSAPNLPAFSCVVHRTERQRARPLAAHSLQSGRIPHRNAVHRSAGGRSEEHTSELQSLMRISYAVFCVKKKKNQKQTDQNNMK